MRRLTIGLDLRPTEEGFKAHHGRGTGRYAGELVSHLLQGEEARTDRPIQMLPVSSRELKIGTLEQCFYRMMPLGRNTLEQQFLLPNRIARLKVDAFHFLSHVDAPARCPVPYFLTVLDLIPLRFPDLYSADKSNWRFRFARSLELKAIKKAQGLIAISEATKRDLIEILGIPAEHICITPLAVGPQFIKRGLADQEWKKTILEKRRQFDLEIERPVLLYVGGIDARKNITFMLEVFADVCRHYEGTQRPQLVMVGRYEEDNNYSRLVSNIKRLQLEEEVRLLGFISEGELPAIYHTANITLFPSLFEGFGLPVLESMASAVPVIAGANSSIPEVAGDSALLLADNDKESWTKSIIELLDAPDRQRALGKRGWRRAQEFSWEKTASKTLEAYSYFLGEKPLDDAH